MHCGFDRPWKEKRTEGEKRQDVAIFGWDSEPDERDLATVQKAKQRGAYVIGFGSGKMPQLASHRKTADVWFDTGRPADDRVVRLRDGSRVGKINHLINKAGCQCRLPVHCLRKCMGVHCPAAVPAPTFAAPNERPYAPSQFFHQ